MSLFTQHQSTASANPASDWSASQYLKFGSQRTRPVRDLVANILLAQPPKQIVDLGCGPGNSTAVLAARWPDAHISGMDSSPDMLAKARANVPGVEFVQADLHTYSPRVPATSTSRGDGDGDGSSRNGPDLLFSNAVFHWLRRPERIPTVLRLLASQPSGGVFALQVPDNYNEPSHKAMRETAQREGEPWSEYFRVLPQEKRPELDPVETPAEWYDGLISLCETVDVWHVAYQHVMEGPEAIVEWVRSTGLMPFLNVLPAVRGAFLRAYEKRLAEVYPRLKDGKVLLRYPRLFVVATRK
ncbi:trans-aconitate 2-methyltransferase [Coniella lustricola]|uniref:Trans-aconitate 2-methyltransferase n=1 Tax=Coniella lustricola TaxID=2025994 RepID=A0A2T2ZWA7_9PEZI|nr:trans-aconitate 2-methyltransferase [Coniella lustricola]